MEGTPMSKKLLIFSISCFISTIALFAATSYAAIANKDADDGIIIIAHPELDITLTRDEIKRIFLNKKKKWDNHQRIKFVTLGSQETHDRFLRNYVNKTPLQYQRYLRRMIFTGKGRPPLTFKDEQSLVEFVSHNAGAIGYVSSGTDINGAEVVEIKE